VRGAPRRLTRADLSARAPRAWAALLSAGALGAWGCDGDDAPATAGGAGAAAGVTAGATAGAAAGVTAGATAGAAAGVTAGATAGAAAGAAAGATAGATAGAEAPPRGRFDPAAPLPEPAATPLAPPAAIAAPAAHAPDPACAGSWVAEARGWVVDEVGRAVEGAKVQLCVRVAGSGSLLCLMPADTGADGAFSLSVPNDARCLDELTFRSLVPRERYATMYCHAQLSDVGADGVLRAVSPLVLYETRPALASDAASVTLAGDLTVRLDDPSALFGQDLADVWGRPVAPTAPGLCFLGEGARVDGLFTFAPEADVVGAAAALRFPNAAGYAPGAEVALYALGNLDCTLGGEERVEEGDWDRFGTGVVDASGAWVEAPAAGGLPCLSWFGYGPAQP